ncbi:MAG TPA: hypothetical protein VG371_12150 [Solirubrobacteraceae bacterium]|jgi:hypothetical protein|nr:hypothetical protein [Solirubrobacteraceae bacterium]
MSDEPDTRPLITPERLKELEAMARYARQRYDLYKARAYGPHLTSPTRMRELERECTRAEATLRFATAEAKRTSAPNTGY